ncbi:MAG: siderophore-interacting protein [Dehalococcoidia bacterium]
MNQEQQAPRRTRPRPTFRSLQVVRVERPTPSLVRVTLSGPELDGYESRGPAEHIRMWLPQAGYEKPVMPEWTDDGPVMAEGVERPLNRVYTPLRHNPGTKELDIEIVLHPGSGGPGSQWAEMAAAGQWVVIAGPAGPYALDTTAERFVIAADHAGLPAVSTVLAALPSTVKADLYLEVESEDEAFELTSSATLDVHWLPAGHNAEPGSALLGALTSAAIADEARVFVACEAGAMREIRKHLLYRRGLLKEHIHTHGYWKRGEANHPDHDLGDDV